MFRIEPTPTKRSLGKLGKWVVDHDRDTSLEVVTSFSQESIQVLKLVWRGRVIPFDTVQGQGRDESTGKVSHLAVEGKAHV